MTLYQCIDNRQYSIMFQIVSFISVKKFENTKKENPLSSFPGQSYPGSLRIPSLKN